MKFSKGNWVIAVSNHLPFLGEAASAYRINVDGTLIKPTYVIAVSQDREELVKIFNLVSVLWAEYEEKLQEINELYKTTRDEQLENTRNILTRDKD